jgi:Trypsin
MLLRISLVVMALVGSVVPAAAAAPVPPTAASIGGQPVASATEAPWSVHLTMSRPDTDLVGGCSGSIIDATHILTAAHCTYLEGEEPWLNYVARAGITALYPPEQSGEQVREAVEVRRHPYFVGAPVRDVAVLRVEPPFDLAPPNVEAIAVTGSSASPNASLRLFGWGLTGPESFDGQEHSLDVATLEQWRCPAFEGVPSILCGRAPAGSPCPGDSGGGFVGSGPAVYATTSVTIGPRCSAGAETGNVDLGSPEIRRWLEGDESPPRAPESIFYATIGGRKAAGRKARCSSDIWSGEPTLLTAFVEPDSGEVLQRGASSTYVLRASDIGHRVKCVSIAINAGGTTEIGSYNQFRVVAPRGPTLRSARLVRSLRHRRRGERWQVVLVAEPGAVGHSARVTWTERDCGGCRGAQRVRVHQRTRLLSPPLGGDGPVTLRLKMPRIHYVGLTYRASTLVVRLPGLS